MGSLPLRLKLNYRTIHTCTCKSYCTSSESFAKYVSSESSPRTPPCWKYQDNMVMITQNVKIQLDWKQLLWATINLLWILYLCSPIVRQHTELRRCKSYGLLANNICTMSCSSKSMCKSLSSSFQKTQTVGQFLFSAHTYFMYHDYWDSMGDGGRGLISLKFRQLMISPPPPKKPPQVKLLLLKWKRTIFGLLLQRFSLFWNHTSNIVCPMHVLLTHAISQPSVHVE